MRDLSNVIPRETSDLQRIIDSVTNANLGVKELTELYYEVEAQLKVQLLRNHLS